VSDRDISDGPWLATGCRTGTARIWDADGCSENGFDDLALASVNNPADPIIYLRKSL
jgi:WD40 repeat protein